MKEWLADLLSRWYIPREDFNRVQMQSIRDAERFEQLLKKYYDLIDKGASCFRCYSEGEGYEQTEIVRTERIDLHCFVWQIRVPACVFYTLQKPPPIIIKRIAENASVAFRKHVYEELIRQCV